MKRLIITIVTLTLLSLLVYVAYKQHCMTHYCGRQLELRNEVEKERR